MKYGSFFKPSGRYRSEAQLQTAHDYLRYAGELVRAQIEADQAQPTPPPPPVVCASYADHRFDPAGMTEASVRCTRCGEYFENPLIFHEGR